MLRYVVISKKDFADAVKVKDLDLEEIILDYPGRSSIITQIPKNGDPYLVECQRDMVVEKRSEGCNVEKIWPSIVGFVGEGRGP